MPEGIDENTEGEQFKVEREGEQPEQDPAESAVVEGLEPTMGDLAEGRQDGEAASDDSQAKTEEHPVYETFDAPEGELKALIKPNGDIVQDDRYDSKYYVDQNKGAYLRVEGKDEAHVLANAVEQQRQKDGYYDKDYYTEPRERDRQRLKNTGERLEKGELSELMSKDLARLESSLVDAEEQLASIREHGPRASYERVEDFEERAGEKRVEVDRFRNEELARGKMERRKGLSKREENDRNEVAPFEALMDFNPELFKTMPAGEFVKTLKEGQKLEEAVRSVKDEVLNYTKGSLEYAQKLIENKGVDYDNSPADTERFLRQSLGYITGEEREKAVAAFNEIDEQKFDISPRERLERIAGVIEGLVQIHQQELKKAQEKQKEFYDRIAPKTEQPDVA